MDFSRRDFCQLVGAGAVLPRTFNWPETGNSHASPGDADPKLIRLDSNENPYGPSAAARKAIIQGLTDAGRYPETGALITAIAHANGVAESNVLLTVGATEGLWLMAREFTTAERPLVTTAPGYSAIANATESLGHPVIRVPLAADGGVDLDAMLSATGAGLLFLCNPNNPTGTLLQGPTLRDGLARATASGTAVVVGEAYHEYVETPGYESAVSVALENPLVVVNRTFSKLYGLAGLRLGYLIAQEATLNRLRKHRVPLGANHLALAAATAAISAPSEVSRLRSLNSTGRKAAERFFTERGRRFYQAHANFLFVETHRDITELRTACRARGLLIGYPYPPANDWARITIGTPEEMRRGLPILEEVLRGG
jgi:histidinol-phosphate aminotransferase